MHNKIKGGCLCGGVVYSLRDDFKAFYQCHCRQCQQLTGTAFASNFFTVSGNIIWEYGQQKVKQYEHPTREFSKAFCRDRGDALF
ncbi:GFA family protein [Arenicella xantha]|uniref:Glutathione-dependent formaldehyde-activating enzyme n=1 Tax=Arenicella xantha TaxID=644221 RepID=A0A395JKJ1_9GAMM|nr:GFA family protein [Arenicella xantha]RBP51079.1 glutathione-dependent formaldehyde-activating enzyme [Arenicella xantha]